MELFERTTRRYGRPEWGIDSTLVGGERVPVHINTVWERPFCRLLHFERAFTRAPRRPQPKLLIVAPMSGHYATLLRGTVEAFLPNHDVYITDWRNARSVPVAEGRFDLDDYIDYVISILHFLGGDAHVIAVCQPSVPVLAAVALMEADKDPYVPHSMVLMGGPIDTRINSNAVNKLAESRGLDWFRSHVITKVPFPHPGFMRDVYPGFLQLNGFVSMNLDRHLEAHRNLFTHLVKGDGDSAQKHREFYDEYLAVMDLSAEFYLQTVDTVFIRHALPKGEMTHRGRHDRPGQIKRVALLTVEGENDDISGVGQTEAAHGFASTSRPRTRRIICSRRSGTTACSTARASAPRSPRASPISCCRTMARVSRAPPRPKPPRAEAIPDAVFVALCGGPDRFWVDDGPMPLRALLYRRPSEPPAITIAFDREIYLVRVRRHRQARRYTLRIHSVTREVVLTMPPRGSLKQAREFAEKHGGWIAARLGRLPEPAPFAHGAVIPLRGVEHRIAHRQEQRGTVWIESGAGDERLLCVAGEEPHIARRVSDFLKREVKSDLEAASRRAADALGVAIKRVSIRDPSSRWGSCSTTGVLSYSWRLILAPPSCSTISPPTRSPISSR